MVPFDWLVVGLIVCVVRVDRGGHGVGLSAVGSGFVGDDRLVVLDWLMGDGDG